MSLDELKPVIKESVREDMKKKEKKKLLSFKETCEYLECSASALNKWKSENKIPYKKLGKRIYFLRSEIIQSLKDSNYKKYKDLFC